VKFPADIEVPSAAKDLMSKLLVKDPERRLGSKKGLYEILKHKFFKDIDVDKIINKYVNLFHW
jgi:serine/threonine protein kinase